MILKVLAEYQWACYILDFESIYYFIYLILTLCAFSTEILYAVLLIDAVKMSSDLRYLGRVLRINFIKLSKTALLCFTIIYIYSLIGAKIFTSFFESSDMFSSSTIGGTTAETDLSSFFSVSLLKGVLMPEGLNAALVEATIDGSLYWNRFFYDLSFWLLVNFLFLNMMLGQIIDAYAESRNLLRKYDKNIKRKCFVCGLTLDGLEAKTLDWESHVKNQHNLNNYLNYIIHIKDKPLEDCDGFERYVKECISKEKTDFFP